MARSWGRVRIWAAAIAIVLGVFAVEAWRGATHLAPAPTVASLADGRAGKVRFASHDADRGKIDAGRLTGAPVTVTGDLILPREVAGPVPAAVLLHGSDGLSEHQYRYAAALAQWGIAAFVIDSFTPRGVKSTVGNQQAVSPHSMLIDAYAALRLLATHPKIDPRRIALIGWSKGGLVAEWAARNRYRNRLAGDGPGFAAHVAFYPWCGAQDFEIALSGAPLLYLLGERDDWSGAQPCVDYAARLRDAGYRVETVVYPEAQHGFDYEGRFQTYLPHARSWKDCVYFAHDRGFVVARTGRFEKWARLDRYLDSCTKEGAHVASNARARERAMADLRAFLSAALFR